VLRSISRRCSRIGEAAGVNSAISSFGLSVGLAFAGAILLAALSIAFTNKSDASEVLPAAEKEQVAQVLGDDAEVMSDARLEEQLAGEPPDVRTEILRINEKTRPEALQVGLVGSPARDHCWPPPLIPDDAVT
jgi:hypothetical protein